METQVTYDKREVGKRIYKLRRSYGISRDEMAAITGRTAKHYADIERGSVGMSLETLLAIAEYFHVSLDYLLLGKEKGQSGEFSYSEEEEKLLFLMRQLPPGKRVYLMQSLELFAKAWETGNASSNPSVKESN